ncbi:putative glycolipid-binding domain-containing protein [Micromonospora sp. NPDC047707]|uniref:putative glycolipid-binding domain-containing protein n=1 Tax=Micromonospora sp. NPDC047707 TaxID=3154498 RepID=UPI0034533A7B
MFSLTANRETAAEEAAALLDPALDRALLWQRLDVVGTDFAVVDQQLTAADGVALIGGVLPYCLHYRLRREPDGRCTTLSVTTEGAGWRRRVRLRRDAEQWRVDTHESGDLDAALRRAGRPVAPIAGIDDTNRLDAVGEIAIARAPLFATLPGRHRDGSEPTRTRVGLVVPPSLAVVVVDSQRHPLPDGGMRVESDTGNATISFDKAGFVTHWPGVARRAPAHPA